MKVKDIEENKTEQKLKISDQADRLLTSIIELKKSGEFQHAVGNTILLYCYWIEDTNCIMRIKN